MTMLKRVQWYGVFKYLILPFGVVLAKKLEVLNREQTRPKSDIQPKQTKICFEFWQMFCLM